MNTLKETIEEVGGLEQAISIPVVVSDLSAVSFGTENLNDGDEDWYMPGYEAGYEMIEGVEVLFAAAGDDAEKPIAFVIYMPPGSDMLRGYVPKEGNCFDKERNKAYDGYDESEYEFSMEEMRAEVRRLIIRNKEFHSLAAKLNGKVTVGFKKVHPYAKLPTYAHEGDAGMDVYAAETVYITSYKPTLVNTGLIAKIPAGYELQVRPRSGLALKKGITVLNSPGTIDHGYLGQIGVILFWASSAFGEVMEIKAGERIAQLVLAPVTTAHIVEVDDIRQSERGEGGFGSTGK